MNNDVIESNYYSFDEYRKIVEKYSKSDSRELNFQNRLVIQLLDRILINKKDVSVEDISTQYINKESKMHTREYYAWNHTPDLLVVKDWNYENKDKNKEDYIAVVEIKSPILDPISKEKPHTYEEVNEYREKCNKVILTDCYRWILYEKDKKPEIIPLYEDGEWLMEKKENSDFLCEQLGFPRCRKESIHWQELMEKLTELLC